MKQQEILRKIGNILKELNEQYDYLQLEETHLNDLELELFAANAKFLTDHTEILRKINTQNQNQRLTLPEHIETEAQLAPTPAEQAHQIELPAVTLTETTLPPFAESAIAYESHTEPIPEPDRSSQTHSQPTAEYFHPFVEEKTEPEILIEPAHHFDNYDYIRPQPQVSIDDEGNDFSISSHSDEEPVYPHVDLTTEPEPVVTEETTIVTPVMQEVIAEHEPMTTETETYSEEPVAVPQAEEQNSWLTPQHEPTEVIPVHETPSEPEPAAVTEPVEKYYEARQEITAPKPEPDQPLTLNERLSAQLRPNTGIPVAAQQAQAITDIKSAISLNDKMLFVKDLFNGYSLAYSEAIELLNRCKTFEEADRFLKSNYVTKNSWADKAATVDKFYAILHRRFPA